MNIYFAASSRNLQAQRQHYQHIIDTLTKLGHKVLDSWVVSQLNHINTDLTTQELVLYNHRLVQDAELVVIEPSDTSFGVGYFYAQALAGRKPILCLYPTDYPAAELSDIIKTASSSLVTLLNYSLSDLETQLRDYFASLKLADLRKFNFIASAEIMEFIDAGSERENKSKSEFLRDQIHKLIQAKNAQ